MPATISSTFTIRYDETLNNSSVTIANPGRAGKVVMVRASGNSAVFEVKKNTSGGATIANTTIPQSRATTTVQFVAANIANDQTVTIQKAISGSQVFTAKSGAAAANQFQIGTGGTASANNNLTATNFATVVNADAAFFATAVADIVTITQFEEGTIGNGKTCQSSEAGGGEPNGMFKPGASGSQPDNFAGATEDGVLAVIDLTPANAGLTATDNIFLRETSASVSTDVDKVLITLEASGSEVLTVNLSTT